MRLEDYTQYFALDYEQFISKHQVQSRQIHDGVRYEKITDATLVELTEGQNFYFKAGVLQMIYISADEVTPRLWEQFKHRRNTPERTVRSRAGKTANQQIFASRGLTASISHDDVHFIEIYPPCSVEHYLEHIYIEPQPFIR